MNNRAVLCLILCILVFFVVSRSNNNIADDKPVVAINPKPKPILEVIVPTIEIPKLETNYIYNNLDKALVLGQQHHKKIIIVFGAEWCPYCEILKKDANNNMITPFDEYIIAFLDTDKKEANQQHLNTYKPRSLPTSILVDNKGKELSRKIGYKNKDYLLWLKSLPK